MDEEKLEGGRFFMKHITNDQWRKYINDELHENVREQYESHLYSCDQCLDLYLELIEKNSASLPEFSYDSTFTDVIMNQVIESNKQMKDEDHHIKIHSNQKKIQQKTFIHYVLAVAMTFVLMSTGVFQQLMGVVNQFESSKTESDSSFVMQMMNKPSSITSMIENNLQEGKKNE